MTDTHSIVLFTGVQRLARRLRNRGHLSACLTEPDELISSPEEVDLWIPYDPTDLKGLEAWARQWALRDRVVGVINRRERRVEVHARLNRALNRPGIDLEQARLLRDKYLFRKALAAKAPHLNPPFQSVDLASPAPPDLPFPCILKPRNLFKSQLITLCRSPQDWNEVRLGLASKTETAGDRHGVQVEGAFLAEAYLEGKEFSLDAFVTQDGLVIPTPVVELTPARRWDMEDFHVAVRQLPSTLSVQQEERAVAVVEEAIQTLGLRATPVHADLVLVGGTPVILEMAPRIGGYRSEMMDLAFGCPLDELNLDLALGQPPQWKALRHSGVAVAELFPPRPGRLTGIHGLEHVRVLPSFHRLRQRISLGESVGQARDGFRCPIFVALHHEDPRRVRQDVDLLRHLVHIDVEPWNH